MIKVSMCLAAAAMSVVGLAAPASAQTSALFDGTAA